MRSSVLIPLLFVFMACAHKAGPKLVEKPYLKDQVSVRTVLMQTHAAYIRGCLKAYQEMRAKERDYEFCKAKADTYLETDVLSILDQ